MNIKKLGIIIILGALPVIALAYNPYSDQKKNLPNCPANTLPYVKAAQSSTYIQNLQKAGWQLTGTTTIASCPKNDYTGAISYRIYLPLLGLKKQKSFQGYVYSGQAGLVVEGNPNNSTIVLPPDQENYYNVLLHISDSIKAAETDPRIKAFASATKSKKYKTAVFREDIGADYDYLNYSASNKGGFGDDAGVAITYGLNGNNLVIGQNKGVSSYVVPESFSSPAFPELTVFKNFLNNPKNKQKLTACKISNQDQKQISGTFAPDSKQWMLSHTITIDSANYRLSTKCQYDSSTASISLSGKLLEQNISSKSN